MSGGPPSATRTAAASGMMMLFEADNRAAAQALVDNSPYKRAGIYEHYHLFEYRDEVG